MAKRIFITAAEVSGDLHASHLIRCLRELEPGVIIESYGGARMREAGAILHREITNAAAMGFSALGRVREMLEVHRPVVEALRDALLERHELIGDEILDVIGAVVSDPGAAKVLFSTDELGQ